MKRDLEMDDPVDMMVSRLADFSIPYISRDERLSIAGALVALKRRLKEVEARLGNNGER